MPRDITNAKDGSPGATRIRGVVSLLALLAWLLLAAAIFGQDLARLPPVEARSGGFDNPPLLYDPLMPVGYPGDLSQPLVDDFDDFHAGERLVGQGVFAESEDGDVAPQRFSPITRSKQGFFQKLYLAETYIPRDGSEGLGFNDIEIALSVAVPLPNRRNPLIITPGFTTHFVDGPAGADLPPRLYDAYIAFTWYPRFTPNWGAIVSVAPSLFTDFEKWDDRAFRLPGKLLLRYTWAQYEREIVVGVVYLDRDDVPWLPAAGVIWTPNPYVAYELLFPRPRAMLMINEQPEHEDWLYLAGEFGGGSWSIQRVPSATQDVVTFADYRLIVGLERRMHGGAGFRLEAGYVFGRSFEYASTGAEFTPDDALMVRGTLTF